MTSRILDGMYKVEQTICACSSGNMDTDGWAHSCIVALGMSGVRNPLGVAALHLLEHPSAQNRRIAAFHLSERLIKSFGLTESDAIEVANEAIGWFVHRRCATCTGRGVINAAQAQCQDCGGTGASARPSGKRVADAVGMLVSAIDWLEEQLRARLRMGA